MMKTLADCEAEVIREQHFIGRYSTGRRECHDTRPLQTDTKKFAALAK